MNLAGTLKDEEGHFLKKQSKVAFVTAEGEAPTHVLMQGESPELQKHSRTEHPIVLLQSSSNRQVATSQCWV